MGIPILVHMSSVRVTTAMTALFVGLYAWSERTIKRRKSRSTLGATSETREVDVRTAGMRLRRTDTKDVEMLHASTAAGAGQEFAAVDTHFARRKSLHIIGTCLLQYKCQSMGIHVISMVHIGFINEL